MKTFVFAFLGAVAVALPTVNTDDFEEHTFDNLIDHFNFQDNRTYKQRYWINEKYWTD